MKTSHHTHKHQRKSQALHSMENTKDETWKLIRGDRVEKMPIPYLKANKRNSHPEMTLDKKEKKKNKLKNPPVSFAFQLLFQMFLSMCASMWSADNVCGQFYTSTVCVTAPASVSQPLPLPAETSNHPCSFETGSPLLSPSQCWDSRPIHTPTSLSRCF